MDANIINIIIHWTRHAESCSNYDGESYQDKNIDRPLGFGTYSSKNSPEKSIYQDKINTDFLTTIKAKFKYHPNLSYIGMQHAILLGSNFVKPENTQRRYNAVFSSATIRSIMTALMAFRGTDIIIYVIPYINEVPNFAAFASMDYQNTPYKSEILKRQIAFIKDWLLMNWISRFDDIEVMQNLIHLKKILLNADDYLDNHVKYYESINIINDILSCKSKHGALLYGTIDMNIYNSCFDNYTPHGIQKLYDNLSKNQNEDIKNIVSFLRQTIDHDFIRGPHVDFSILEYFERTENDIEMNTDQYLIHQNLREPNMNKFYEEILPIAFSNGIINDTNNVKILCVSHGSLMKNFFPKYYENKTQINTSGIDLKHLLNTQVFEEILDFIETDIDSPPQINQVSIQYDKYIPIPIRTNYENFELLNTDICRVESIKGIINYPVIDINLADKLIPTKTYISEIFDTNKTKPEDIVASDVKFYFDTNSKLNGGLNNPFYRKYLKYKLKYHAQLEKLN